MTDRDRAGGRKKRERKGEGRGRKNKEGETQTNEIKTQERERESHYDNYCVFRWDMDARYCSGERCLHSFVYRIITCVYIHMYTQLRTYAHSYTRVWEWERKRA